MKRPAIGAEGFVLDHYDQTAIEAHLHAVGDRLMELSETILLMRYLVTAWRTTDPIGLRIY